MRLQWEGPHGGAVHVGAHFARVVVPKGAPQTVAPLAGCVWRRRPFRYTPHDDNSLIRELHLRRQWVGSHGGAAPFGTPLTRIEPPYRVPPTAL
eukprot:5814853-Pyramimonas_sp.AAC.1